MAACRKRRSDDHKGHFGSMQKGWRYAFGEKLTNANTKFRHPFCHHCLRVWKVAELVP